MLLTKTLLAPVCVYTSISKLTLGLRSKITTIQAWHPHRDALTVTPSNVTHSHTLDRKRCSRSMGMTFIFSEMRRTCLEQTWLHIMGDTSWQSCQGHPSVIETEIQLQNRWRLSTISLQTIQTEYVQTAYKRETVRFFHLRWFRWFYLCLTSYSLLNGLIINLVIKIDVQLLFYCLLLLLLFGY